MFSRRPGPLGRFNRRGVGSAVGSGASAAFTPAGIVGNLDYWQTFVGGAVTTPRITTATGVSAWQSQTSSSTVAEGTGANQPTVNATDATLNSLQTITFDGSNDRLVLAAYNRPAPGTTPTCIYMLAKLGTWTANKVIFAGGSAALTLQELTASPRIVQVNPTTVNGNDGFTATNTWKRVVAFWNNDTSDFSTIGGATVTGAAAGNNAGGNLTFGANNGLTQFGGSTWAYVQLFDRLPTLTELQNLDAYLAALIGTAAPFS